MIGAALPLLAALASLACAWLAWSQVRRASSPRDPSLPASLKRLPEAERLAELARRAAPSTWEHHLATSLLEAQGDDARVARLNEELLELDHALAVGARWPATAVRLAIVVGVLLAAVSFMAGVPGALPVLAIAAAGAAASLEAWRRAKLAADTRRADVDALVQIVAGPMAARCALPPRRGHRRDRARGRR